MVFMLKVPVTIINKLGLHARASAKFVSLANRYQSSLEVTKDQKTINGKSIMAVMLLAATQGTSLTLTIDGPDEEALSQALTTLIEHRFDELE